MFYFVKKGSPVLGDGDRCKKIAEKGWGSEPDILVYSEREKRKMLWHYR